MSVDQLEMSATKEKERDKERCDRLNTVSLATAITGSLYRERGYRPVIVIPWVLNAARPYLMSPLCRRLLIRAGYF